MKFVIKILALILIFPCMKLFSQEFLYILNDDYINNLVKTSEDIFTNSEIQTIRDTRGIILRFNLENPINEVNRLTYKTYQNSLKIKDFLAKIENPAIIEVHTEGVAKEYLTKYKNWELSTIIANNIESVMLSDKINNMRHRINSIGYGEFLPSKNTPNNGGKYSNRVDIIILCNIGGE